MGKAAHGSKQDIENSVSDARDSTRCATPGTRQAAQEFVERWQDRGDERQDTQHYWIDLMQSVIGMPESDVVSMLLFEAKGATNADTGHNGYADLLIPAARTIVEQKSSWIDLDKPEKRQGRDVTPIQQAYGYVEAMPDSQKPRYVITCNFKTIRIYDRDLDPMCRRPPKRELALADIPTNVSALSFLRGTSGDTIESHAVNARAGELMGQLHDIAAQGFSDPDTPEAHHALSVLMTRLMFLLFCEDAGILADEQFTSYVSKYDADDLRGELKRLFSWLGTPDEDRDEYASKCIKAFPYIGGDLFGEDTDIPPLTDEFRDRVIAAGNELDWSGVSPTVFGSIFEGTLSHDHRREQGQHFTSPENIHKVIDPLFMDYLEGEFNKANSQPKRGNRRIDALTRFHRHLGEISILDPACGSGNFLTESYLSLRALEDRVIAAIHDATGHSGQASLDLWGGNADGTNDDSDVDDATSEVLVSLRNFHGIELEDFACCVARTALWIAEKQADARTAAIVQRSYDPLPLTNYHSIRHANALRIDWNDVVPASDVTYVIGNPPFLGARMQSKEQKAELMDVFDHAKNSGNIDYVAGWYMKAAKYAEDNPVRCAFVSTNSICQGEQVANVWKPMSDLGFHIDFAYRSFKWKNEASDPAAVTVIIVGFSKQRHEQKVIWDEHGQRHEVGNINAYLVDGPNKFVWNRNMPLCNVPLIGIGNQPIDGGYYLFKEDEKDEFVREEPGSAKFFHPWLGGEEFINGKKRYVLWLGNASPAELTELPHCIERIRQVRDFRAASKRTSTQRLADTPTRFCVENMPEGNSIVIPEVSSDRRKFIPMGFVGPEVLCSNKLKLIPNATLYHYGILQSTFHNAWMRRVGGRLGTGYSYSGGVVYNNFVFPGAVSNPDVPVEDAVSDDVRSDVERCAQAVLDARKEYAPATLAEMYDPDRDVIYPDLIRAHSNLDAAVEAAYGVDFNGDESQIVSHLFGLYAQMVRVRQA